MINWVQIEDTARLMAAPIRGTRHGPPRSGVTTMKATIDKKAGTLTIVIDINKVMTPSTSGKTLAVASTHGNQVTDQTVDGKPLVIGLNAYIKAG